MPGYPHDGFLHNNQLWITCVNGTILAYKIKHGIVTPNIAYSKNIFKYTTNIGWCRGILIIENFAIIGITKIYNSTQHYWSDYPSNLTKTGIICWDLDKNKEISFVDLSERQSKIFSVLKGPGKKHSV